MSKIKKEKNKKVEEVVKEEQACECDSCGCDECIDECECSKQDENITDEDIIDDTTPDEEEILVLKNTIENLQAKVKQTQAELINYRKRKDEEVSSIIKYANKDLITELLVILDNFERALKTKNETPEFEKYSEGYKLLYNGLVDILKKFGVEEIDALNKEFDPNLHEAVMIGNNPELEDDIVLEVFNKGYMLKGRVIRPAKVKVNKI